MHPATAHIMQFFTYAHLPPHLAAVSEPFSRLAEKMAADLPDNAEKTAGLRKLLESKDCMVRALLAKAMALVMCLAIVTSCASYPDIRPTMKNIDEKALAVWQRSLEAPPKLSEKDAEELRKAHLELCLQARKAAKAAQGE